MPEPRAMPAFTKSPPALVERFLAVAERHPGGAATQDVRVSGAVRRRQPHDRTVHRSLDDPTARRRSRRAPGAAGRRAVRADARQADEGLRDPARPTSSTTTPRSMAGSSGRSPSFGRCPPSDRRERASPVAGGRGWAPSRTTAAPRSGSGRRMPRPSSSRASFDDWDGHAHAARPRRRRHGGHLVRGRRRASAPGDEYRFTIRTAGRRRVAARSVRATGHQLGRQRDRLRPGRVRLGRRRVPACPAGTTSSSTSSTSGRSRGGPDQPRRLRPRGPAAPYLRDLGISAIQLMPPFEFAGDVSWGYNPAYLFAIESRLRRAGRVQGAHPAAHEHGIAVILDVVYNHLGPSDLDLWQFDGWAEGDGGGIYFYEDERATTPWGDTRPDYGRGEVRHVPARQRDDLARGVPRRRPALGRDAGSRPSTAAAAAPRTARRRLAVPGRVNDEIAERQPWQADDRRGPPFDDPALVAPTAEGGAGFGAQWDAGFVHFVRPALRSRDDDGPGHRAVVGAITRRRPRAPRAGSSTPSRTTRTPTARPACPRRSGPATRTVVGRKAGDARRRDRPDRRRASRCCSRARSCSRTRWFDDRSPRLDEGRHAPRACCGCTAT